MNKQKENRLVPKLRFPEFRDAGEWEISALGDLIDIISNRNRQNSVNRVFHKLSYIWTN